jgi:hypothetical protein
VPNPAFASHRLRWALSACGLAAFVLGLSIYAIERDATRLSGVPPDLALSAGRAPWALLLRESFPSFAHTWTFALLGCTWFARSWRQAIGIGLTLWAVDVSLELLQYQPLHAAIDSPRWIRRLLASTFDPHDLLASTLGVVAAWCTLAAGRCWQGKSRA